MATAKKSTAASAAQKECPNSVLHYRGFGKMAAEVKILSEIYHSRFSLLSFFVCPVFRKMTRGRLGSRRRRRLFMAITMGDCCCKKV